MPSSAGRRKKIEETKKIKGEKKSVVLMLIANCIYIIVVVKLMDKSDTHF